MTEPGTDREPPGEPGGPEVRRVQLRDRLAGMTPPGPPGNHALATSPDGTGDAPGRPAARLSGPGPETGPPLERGSAADDEAPEAGSGRGIDEPVTPPTEDELRVRLGLRPLAARTDPATLLWGWVGPLAVATLAAVVRLVGLTHPGRLIFDETYYVKEAFSLLTLGYEGDWPAEDANARFLAGDYSALSTEADYVVHPAVGKWMIALGIQLFGADNGTGWRFSGAVVGALSVLLLARVATRMFRSPLLGTTAGLLLALDGIHLTLSRTALLDIFLSFWVLVGLWFVLRDRESSRAALARRVAAETASGRTLSAWGPRVGPRWWLVGAGAALGLASGVKWSGIYAVAVLGVLAFAWDVAARRAVGTRLWLGSGVFRGGLPAFVALVPTAALTYVAGWFSWFVQPDAYRRQWAADLRAAGDVVPRGWLPDAVNSWWEYHLVMWQFHNNLDSEHTYEAHPAGWLLQLRPTSMYWPDPAPPPEACGAERCVEAIVALGNPAVWWAGAAALLVVVYLAARRDWRAWAVLAGYGAMYVPWLFYSHRTIFTFYSVAFVPYVVLGLVMALGWVMGIVRPPGAAPVGPDDDGDGGVDGTGSPTPLAWVVLALVVGLTVALFVFFWPVWTGRTIAYDAWLLRMWLPRWV